MINATSSFSPTSGANLTTDDINTTLAYICKDASGCDDSIVRTWLSSFYAACQPELTGADAYNAQVRELYDILYVVNPLQAAVCAIDSSNQDYCVNEIIAAEKKNGTGASGTGNNTLLVNLATDTWSPVAFAADNLYIAINSATSMTKRMLTYLSTRGSAQSANLATIITPNVTTYRTTNLPFLFLQPSMSSSALCTPCTREILAAYIQWEVRVPYALGLSQSPILGGQSELWSAINLTCGAAYTSAITSEVGSFATTDSSGSPVGGAMSTMSISTGALLFTVVAGFAALFT